MQVTDSVGYVKIDPSIEENDMVRRISSGPTEFRWVKIAIGINRYKYICKHKLIVFKFIYILFLLYKYR